MHDFNNQRIFMQDSSPIHTSAIVMNYLSRQAFEILDWPPSSPDLNQIENLWSEMTYEWSTLEHRTQENTNAVVRRKWVNLGNNPVPSCVPVFKQRFISIFFVTDYFHRLYESLP